MKSVILAGGLGTRLREETEFRPKPMVPIGDKPILWHIMKNLSQQNLNEFVIALGYKGEMIKEYFFNYGKLSGNLMIDFSLNKVTNFKDENLIEDWKISLIETGPLTSTGGRIYRLRDYIGKSTFLCTYGDGVANIDVKRLLEFHRAHGKIATITAAHPVSRFGSLSLGKECEVLKFAEKPHDLSWVNAGFFVFNSEIFEYLSVDCVLEHEPMERLARDGEIFAYKHEGFWKPMDTLREAQELNQLWDRGDASWKNW